MKKEILISIIIPIYNAEKYLHRTIESVLKQTYGNYELILINDGSTDDSEKICYEYAKNSLNISVINIPNSGVSNARNKGLKVAKGEYIMFLDSDDWIDSDCLQNLVKELKQKKYDVIMFPYIREYGNVARKRKLFCETKTFSKKEIFDEIFLRLIGPSDNQINNPSEMDIYNAVWGKIIKSNLAKQITFLDYRTMFGEDLVYNIMLFQRVKSCKYIDNIYYHYNKQNNNSLTKIAYDEILSKWDKMYDIIENEFLNNYSYNDKIKIELSERLKRRIYLNRLTITQQFFFSDENIKIKNKKIKEMLSNNRYMEYKKNIAYKKMGLKWRVFYKSCDNKNMFLLDILLYAISKIKKWG